MKVIGVIPSRYASTRFPGKPLAKIHGKELLRWVIEACSKSKKLSALKVATDHEEIAALAQSCQVPVVMTDSNLATGSDRVWQACKEDDFDVVVNIQGDEPLLKSSAIDELITCFERDPEADMASLARDFHSSDEIQSEQTAKILVNEQQRAIYFSRFPIPFSREKDLRPGICKKHIGIYAYKKDFLKKFCQQKPTEIEKAESLEQLRALYLGAKIALGYIEDESWGVDYPEDVARIEALIKDQKDG